MDTRVFYFKKQINNNVALVVDEQGIDWMVLGKGIAFGKKNRDIISEVNITKKFIAASGKNSSQIIEIVSSISSDIIESVAQIINSSEVFLEIEYTNEQYVALLDHINLLIKNEEKNQFFSERQLWETSVLYPKEFRAAEKTVSYLMQDFGISIPDQEKIFLSYHFVNARSEIDALSDTIKMTKIINLIISKVEEYSQKKLLENTVSVQRFFTHIRYFVIRQLKNERLEIDETNIELLETVKQLYSDSYQNVLKIADILKEEEGWIISDTELLYLTIHIQKVTS